MRVLSIADVSLREVNNEVLTLINSHLMVPTKIIIGELEVVHEVDKPQNVCITQHYISESSLQPTLTNTS